MKNKYWILVAAWLLGSGSVWAQISGNQSFGRDNRSENVLSNENLYGYWVTDSTFTVNVKILLQKTADKYVLTLGLNQEAQTPKDCNAKITERINGFLQKLKNIGLKKEAVFVDFIAQNKIYDYVLSENKATQIEKGFELKKNVIVTTNKFADIDKIIELAAEFGIYDVIKVDYINDNVEEIHQNLWAEALKISAKRLENYQKSFLIKTIGNPNISERFLYIFPNQQYKEYTAFESAEFQDYSHNSSYAKQIARKNKTFYYDGIDRSSFDKIINAESPEVGIQYILLLKQTYRLEHKK